MALKTAPEQCVSSIGGAFPATGMPHGNLDAVTRIELIVQLQQGQDVPRKCHGTGRSSVRAIDKLIAADAGGAGRHPLPWRTLLLRLEHADSAGDHVRR